MHFSNTPAPRPSGLLRVASVNVNGIRAAYKKDMAAWLASRDIDILCLQEVRAPDAIVRELLDESQWHILHAEAAAKGRAGVLVATRRTPNSAGEVLENQPVATRSNIGEEYFDDSGRWVEADYVLPNGKTLTVVSAYVHSGEVGTQKQDDKYRFLERMLVRMPELAKHSDHVLIVGDLNVGHTELDIRTGRLTRSVPASCRRNAPTLTASSAISATAMWLVSWRVRCPAPTPGGLTAARRSIMTQAGVSTTTWRPRRSPKAPWKRSWTARQATTSVSAITRRSWLTTASVSKTRTHLQISF